LPRRHWQCGNLFERDATAAGCRLVDALARCWTVAIDPYWRSMRSVLDDDVAFRAGELAKGGVGELLTDLHPQISMRYEVLSIDKRHNWQQDLTGDRLVLVPSVFVWPNLIFAAGRSGPVRLIYPARGVGHVWQTPRQVATGHEALSALLGRSRAAILVSLALPRSTTEIAVKLGRSPASVASTCPCYATAVWWFRGVRAATSCTDAQPWPRASSRPVSPPIAAGQEALRERCRAHRLIAMPVVPGRRRRRPGTPGAGHRHTIKHVVVLFHKNVPFDRYFGVYPHALNAPGGPSFVAKPGTPTVNRLTDELRG
jgi:hypothetical protein